MTTQSEYQLEEQLIAQLQTLGYDRVKLHTEGALLANLKTQIERVNGIPPLSASEWKQVITHLSIGSIFERAKLLRDRFPVKFDDGSSRHIQFLFDDASQNYYQVTNQITIDHKSYNGRTSRFDVTLLVNGLPLTQIELKKRGMEITEAFNQTSRYNREAYARGYGLFQFIQLFVISNGVNTRYYANGTKNIEFTFPWTDFKNNQINDITQFSDNFLNPSHFSKMLNKYMVLLDSSKQLMVLRPYQIYAVEQIENRVQHSNKNGFIWHTTGSGKTLTSFKASQLIMKMPDVEKVLFVVDRNDLDTQTAKEFNAFKPDSVDSTTNTKVLVDQLDQRHDKLIVTTLQKLNRAISTDRYIEQIDYLRDKKVVFIFDECHRSQFGDTHKNIKKFFNQAQMFGFTGTPILEQNSIEKIGDVKRTTASLFDECLHSYVIVDAIRDKNVLAFQIDYRGKYTAKGMDYSDPNEEVESIDTKELFDNPKRLEMITRYIVDHHDTKTKKRDFTAMFCVSSVDILTQYYELFEKVQADKQRQAEEQGRIFKPLTIATIFSYGANEEVKDDGSGLIDEENTDVPAKINQSNRDKLDRYIANYNQQFKTNFNSGDQFYAYYRDIANKVKSKQIDILMVVNMFLTGFDSKTLNTLYVDKNLKHHGLIQAFSRTNRILDANKSFGNILCFRNLKRATDEALALFSDKKEADKVVLIPSYAEIVQEYHQAVEELLKITPECQAVDALLTEEDQLAFIKAFRTVMRYNAQLENFVEYEQDQTILNKQDFLDFASKYKDLCNSVKSTTQKDKVSVLDDVDFQLELLHSDRVNVGYIINLLQLAINSPDQDKRKQYEAQVHDLVAGDISLHNKQDLIQKFIDENMPKLITGQSVQDAFSEFWDVEKEQAYQQLCAEEQLKPEQFKKVLDSYEFTKRMPSREDVNDLPITRPKLSERKTVMANLVAKTQAFIEKFFKGI